MDVSLLWRAALGQLIAVGALFLLLLALPLSDDFFRDYGAAVGPVSWLVCALVTGRVLALGPVITLRAAVVSGAAGGLVGLSVDHSLGLLVGIAVFGVAVAVQSRRDPASERPSTAAAS